MDAAAGLLSKSNLYTCSIMPYTKAKELVLAYLKSVVRKAKAEDLVDVFTLQAAAEHEVIKGVVAGSEYFRDTCDVDGAARISFVLGINHRALSTESRLAEDVFTWYQTTVDRVDRKVPAENSESPPPGQKRGSEIGRAPV